MHSHLDIQVEGRSLALRPDQSIDIEDRNPLFNNTEMFSLPIDAPVEGNRVVFRNVDDIHSGLRPSDMEHRAARIVADGVPMRSGVTVVQEGQEVGDTMSLSIDDSTVTFEDLVSDLKCRDVPLKDDIVVGEKIGRVDVTVRYDAEVHIGLGGGSYANTGRVKDLRVTSSFEPQALGFSWPGRCEEVSAADGTAKVKTVRTYPGGHTVNVPAERDGRDLPTYINVSEPYGSSAGSPHTDSGGATIAWPYCNARVCYLHKGLGDDGATTAGVAEPSEHPMYEDHWPYWVLEADRPASGLCFYVRYFLDCLWDYLGVTFDGTALDAVPDLGRLCFFSTRCEYSTTPRLGKRVPLHTLSGLDAVNRWLSSRGCGGQLELEPPEQRELDYYRYTGTVWSRGVQYRVTDMPFAKGEETRFGTVTWIKSIPHPTDSSWWGVESLEAEVVNMYATGDNFPDASVQDVLDSLEASFGIRFRYDYQQNRVTAYLMRDVFRQGAAADPRPFNGTLLSAVPLTEKITGVRMKYSAESDPDEQMDNIRRQKRDYDTDFDYIDYPDGRVVTDKEYKDFFTEAGDEDMRVYVDLHTGNAYRVKINSDASTADEKKPVWFEVGQFKGVEIGDCSKRNEDYVREFVSQFQPMSWNDVNFQQECSAVTVSGTGTDETGGAASYSAGTATARPLLAAFTDEDMEHEFVLSKVRTSVSPALYAFYMTQKLTLTESYDPTGTDGGSPLGEADWGLSVALMRGGGTDASVQEYDHGYDGFGNDKWRTVSGEYAMASDTIDQFGNEFDYNGESPGIGSEDRFSLKIRAWKPFLYYTDATGRTHVTADLALEGQPVSAGSSLTWQRPFSGPEAWGRRGLYDTFMKEYAWFLLNRKPLRLRLLTTAAQLADVPLHWMERWNVGGLTGYIDRMKYSIAAEEGLGTVEMDFYCV
jgi:hypothetical protein